MKKQLSNGSVELKEIDVADKMILIGELGYSFQQIEKMMGAEEDEKTEEVSAEQMVFMGKLIKKFNEYVISLNVMIKGKQVTNYVEAIKNQDFVNEILPIASQSLLGDEGDVEKKQD